MACGAPVPYALGSDQCFYVLKESAWNTWTAWGATDGMAVLKTGFEPKQPREVRADSRKTRSALERFTGVKETPWNVDSYLVGASAAGSSAGALASSGPPQAVRTSIAMSSNITIKLIFLNIFSSRSKWFMWKYMVRLLFDWFTSLAGKRPFNPFYF